MRWIINHPTWLVTRFLLHADGLSLQQRLVKQEPVVGIAECGEAVCLKSHGRRDVANADSSFTRGMWVGRDSDSGEHLIANAHGVSKPVTIKRVVPS